MRDPFAVVCMIGNRLQQAQHGWRDAKALVMVVALEGDWNGAAALASALGIGEERQEAIYREVSALRRNPHATTTPAPFPSRRRTP